MKQQRRPLLKKQTWHELAAEVDRDDMLALIRANGGRIPTFTIREIGVRELPPSSSKLGQNPVRGGNRARVSIVPNPARS